MDLWCVPDGSVVEPDGDDTEKPVTTEKPDSLEVGDGDTDTKAENDTKKSVIEKQQVSPEVTTTALSDSPSNTNNQASDADTEGTSLKVSLASNLYLGPQQTKVASVHVKGVQPQNTSQVGLLSPHSKLASQCCDFIEELWYGEESLKVLITNWTTEPILIERDQVVGEIEEVSVVNRDDPIWEEQPELVARLSESGSSHLIERKTQLEEQLQIGDDCTVEEQDTLKQLLLDSHQVFALTDEELGETDLVEHHIEMTEHKPIKVFPRRLPYALWAELETKLDQLLSIGCIEPSCSPYASGLVLVWKKDGRLRVCVNYRGINKYTVPDRYPIPRIDELIDTVGRQKGKIFTSLDLMKGYHQIRVADSDRPKTASICHQGLFQFRRMPFGLTNAPATFQRLMEKLFSGKEWEFVFVYLDDLLIVSISMEEHVQHGTGLVGGGKLKAETSEMQLCKDMY